MISDRGEVAIELAKAVAAGKDFPAGVEDTPANRQLFADIQRNVSQTGYGVEIPFDHALLPDQQTGDDSITSQLGGQ